ncbi:MAG: SpoIIE family protein phosphatase [Desulfopila sp.]
MAYLMLPTLLVLLITGTVSLYLIRQALLGQWEQAALAKMQTVANEVDNRLRRPKRLLALLQQTEGDLRYRPISQFLLDQLREIDGVIQVSVVWNETGNAIREAAAGHMSGMSGRMLRRTNSLEVTIPTYDTEFKGKTVSLMGELKDAQEQVLGHIEVKISFFDLIDSMTNAAWWDGNRAYLVDMKGNVLTRVATSGDEEVSQVVDNDFGKVSEVEKRTLVAMQKSDGGTVFGRGLLGSEVSSFYRLDEAPWTIVGIVPGETAFQSLRSFRDYYFTTVTLGAVVVLSLILTIAGNVARRIEQVSRAANDLARGEFGEPLLADRSDEVGDLARNFNIMTRQLRERLELQQAMGMAREVQQNFLPQSSYRAEGVAASGRSLYCEETGGDYFDLLPDRDESRRIQVVIGDVVGHGIGAALLMASVRALIRSQTSLADSPAAAICGVNEILCRDTEKSSNFVSLFYLVIDREAERLQWVRCGHDPAIVYDIDTHDFFELDGEGIVLGIDADWPFQHSTMDITERRLLILLGSDGVWEAENEQGEKFGKERLRSIMADKALQRPEEIATTVIEAVQRFQGEREQEDDITLVIAQIGEPQRA